MNIDGKNTDDLLVEAFDARAARREERREFFRAASGMAMAVGGVGLLAACGSDDNGGNCPTPTPTPAPTPTPTPTPTFTDQDILNFALNLEYLEAQFYYYASFGTGLPANILTGTGTQGAVIPGRAVDFGTDNVVRQYAREIANDERAHVEFLRTALGSAAVAQPAIDVGFSPTSAFSAAARSAGIVGPGVAFDPYESPNNFLLGAYIFEDVGVTAYKGASPLITSRTFLEAAAGILAAEAYHAGLIRTVLFARGEAVPALRTNADDISNARDSLDGATDLDQGITGNADQSNIVPTDSNGLAFSRTTGQVLNIVYLNRMAVTMGGFFPAGVNGTNVAFRTSGAN